jgi:hypothetical protein
MQCRSPVRLEYACNKDMCVGTYLFYFVHITDPTEKTRYSLVLSTLTSCAVKETCTYCGGVWASFTIRFQ